MNFEETEVLYNVYRGILRNNRSFQTGKEHGGGISHGLPGVCRPPEKSIPLRKIAGKGTDLQRAIRVLKIPLA